MAAVFGRTEVQIKKTGGPTTVPNSPRAKLMYYFNCVCCCVEAESDASIRRLRNYKENYTCLSNEEEVKLVVLCLALSPDKLIGSIFFPAEDSAFDRGNEFFELSAVSTKLVVAESLLIGGQQKRVHKIMMFKMSWIENNYIEPMRSIVEGNSRALPSSQPPPARRSQPPPARRSQPPPARRSQPPPARRSQPPPAIPSQQSDDCCCTIL